MNLYATQGKEARLRRGPDHRSEVMATLPEGTEVEILEESGRFLRVRVRDHFQADMTGYLPMGFVSGYKAVFPSQEAPKPSIEPCPRCGGKEWAEHDVYLGGTTGRLHIPLGFLSSVVIMARVCLTCGYVEPCVSSEGVAELRAQRQTRT